MAIARVDWLRKVLLPNLQRHWSDADALYGHVVDGLNSGFHASLLPAAQRLHVLDAATFPERGCTILAIVLMKLGRAADAQALLTDAVARVGRRAVLLVNLAKTHAELGNEAQADALLWEGVQGDPNLDNGLGWWLARERERGGEAAYLAALNRAADLPGSWLPQLWLARHRLDQGDVPAAVALHRTVLARPDLPDAALMMVSGDLGQRGHVALIPELIAPRYDAERGDPMVALNLLQSYRELGQWQAGEALLQRLMRRTLPPWKQRFDEFSAAFTHLRLANEPPLPQPSLESLRVETHVVSQPLWTYGLREPTWLLAPKPDDAPVVAILPLACLRDPTAAAQHQREDNEGRRSRSLAFYWAEAVHLWTGHAGHVYLPIGNGEAPIVFGALGNPADVAQDLPPQVQHLVQGSLRTHEGALELRLQVWSRAGGALLMDETRTAPEANLGRDVLELEQALLRCLGPVSAVPSLRGYQRHAAEDLPHYLDGLGQLLTLTLVANGIGSKAQLWGERAMLEWPLKLGVQWPQHVQHALMLLATLSKAHAYGSDLLPELKERALLWLGERAAADERIDRLRPLAWWLLGMSDDLASARANTDMATEYGRWLAALDQD